MREGWKRFWDRFGYLCVLSACLAMVAVTAVWTRPIAEAPQAPEVTRYASPTPAPTPQPASVEVTIEPAQTQAPFVFPSAGQVGMPFAVQTLVYSETRREYRTHEGVDFLGEEGDPVRAAEDGTVTRVWEDPLMGNCIEITHREGYITRYASLATPGLVQEGAKVACGQVLGTMGTSAAIECAEGPHLHFELWQLQEALDPMKFLREDVE